MPEVIRNPELIEKEMVAALSFHDKSPILQHADLVSQIETAVRLGNAHHSKVSIIFQDDSGLKRVDTTLWANGAKFICLKGGVWIPIARILEIKF
jgi:uncharacterized protein (UPF0248 family)